MRKILAPLIAVLAFFISCSKNNEDNQSPFINLSSPNNHQVFTGADRIPVSASISDDDELQQVHLYIKNKATGVDVFHVEEHPGTKTYNVSKTFAGQPGFTYKIEIEARDSFGNQSEVEIEVSVN